LETTRNQRCGIGGDCAGGSLEDDGRRRSGEGADLRPSALERPCAAAAGHAAAASTKEDVMAKEDLTLVRVLEVGDHGPDVVAVKRMTSRAGVGYPKQVRQKGKFDDHFGDLLEAAIKRLQKKRGLVEDGVVGYMTFKVLVNFADAYDSKLLRDFAKQQIGDWGIIGRKSAWAGIDMGVDFLGAGPIPMFADGKIVRVMHEGSGWPGIGGLIVVQCDKGPMARFPIYAAEDIKIPGSHAVGKQLKKGELLADATGTRQAPGIELGWAGPAPNFRGTLHQARHGHYSGMPRATAEGTDFWKTLAAWMAKGA
jgi:Putative peptidoglycan binding domain